MDYKEKFERAKELYPTANADQRYVLECLFPELVESEDERVRKEIVRFIRMEVEDEIVGNKWIVWLQKQGEYKYTEEDINNAYKCADEVQYKRGYEDALKEVEKQGEQKSAWSEEDEKILSDAIGAIGAADYYTYDDKVEIERWLKSLKDRIRGL